MSLIRGFSVCTGIGTSEVDSDVLSLCFFVDCSRQVLQLIGHGNCIAIAYSHCICVLGYVRVKSGDKVIESLCARLKFRVRESRGWEVIFSTPLLDKPPQRISLNTRSAGASAGEPILAAVVGKCVSE